MNIHIMVLIYKLLNVSKVIKEAMKDIKQRTNCSVFLEEVDKEVWAWIIKIAVCCSLALMQCWLPEGTAVGQKNWSNDIAWVITHYWREYSWSFSRAYQPSICCHSLYQMRPCYQIHFYFKIMSQLFLWCMFMSFRLAPRFSLSLALKAKTDQQFHE